MEQDIKDLLIDKYEKQLKRNNELQTSMINTINNLITENRKSNRFQLVSVLITMVIVVGFFILGYFFSDYEGVKQANSSYNYNENVNKNITE